MPTTPQDRKPKKTGTFTFKAAGKTYTLPPASKGAEKVPGRVMRDALLDGDEGETRLGFLLLEACGAKQEAIDALYDLPAPAMLKLMGQWMQAGDGKGTSLPQS